MRILPFLLFVPFAVMADGFNPLAGDQTLTRDAVANVTNGQVLEFYDGGQSKYSVGGAYSYTYASGASAYGTFYIKPDGVVCVDYANGSARCDQFVRSHNRLVLLTEDGGRYPVRPRPKD